MSGSNIVDFQFKGVELAMLARVLNIDSRCLDFNNSYSP